MSIGNVLGEAMDVYRLLFRRSVLTALLVYAAIDAVEVAYGRVEDNGAEVGFALLSLVLGIAGTVIVQGALVEIVRNIHEGRPPAQITRLYSRAYARLGSLVWASIVYGLGVFFGLLLLIVPGLLAASRWCLMAPFIMLEGESAGDARDSSRDLVRPRTWRVLGAVVATFILTSLAVGLAVGIVSATDAGPIIEWAVTVAVDALTAPFAAHVLTVIYYRLKEPGRPVIHPDVRTWTSVWEGR